MTHSRDLLTRYTKEVAEKGSVSPLQELQETGWCHWDASFLVSYPPHLASFRLLLWACQAVPRPVGAHCRELWALRARFA